MRRLISSIIAAACVLSAASQTGYYLKRDGWQWSTSSDCMPEDIDIRGIDAIADGDESTCWHSNWHATENAERRNPHWVMIDRGSDSETFYGFTYLPRQRSSNQACTTWYLYTSPTPFTNVPATNVSDIELAIGRPVYFGNWEGNTLLKAATFSGTGINDRYILFVNVASYNSSSAACAEFNLLTKAGYENVDNLGGGGSGVTPDPVSQYNAVKITTIAGQEHRIAIDGQNLNISMNNGAVRLSNTGITVEYTPAEVKSYSFENYNFTDDPYYYGTKTDVLTPRFDMVVTPADGAAVGILQSIRLEPRAGALPAINADCALPVTLSRETSNSTKVCLEVTPAELEAKADGNAYVIDGINENKVATYHLSVPADLFVDANDALSNALTATWTVTGEEQSAIENVARECPTLTLRRDGSVLIVGGIVGGVSASLVDTAGHTVASAPVGANGYAILPVGSLPNGIYILSANSITLKITL